MQKITTKILVIILAAGIMAVLSLSTNLLSRAAPALLPSCGNGSVSEAPELNSGPPDIAQSQDAAKTYTAIVWSGDVTGSDNDVGRIHLAYSDVATTTRQWTRFVVDSQTSNQNPTLVFDPDDNSLVHITYRKNRSIYYKRCDILTGNCPITKDVTGSRTAPDPNLTHDSPQIEIMGDTVVIIYQESSATFGNEYQSIRYAYFDPTAGTSPNEAKLTTAANSLTEQNPAVAYSNNRLHIAYATDSTDPGIAMRIRYINLAINELGNSFAADKDFGLVSGEEEAILPTVDALNDFVVLAWEVYELASQGVPENTHRLAYNFSTDNGDTWTTDGTLEKYKYLFPHTASKNDAADWYYANSNPELGKWLHAHVAVEADNIFHLVWQAHANSGADRSDIMHSRFAINSWQGYAPLAFTGAVTYTNVTTIYGQSEQFLNPDITFDLHKVQPAVVYGPPGERVQIAYLSRTVEDGWDVYYTGWQQGDDGASDPSLQNPDSDCDSIPDTEEQATAPACTHPNSTPGPPPDCDGDGIPDFMDDNTDNDLEDDFEETHRTPTASPPANASPTATPHNWREPGIFENYLPTIMK